jgi:hypothetical protein
MVTVGGEKMGSAPFSGKTHFSFRFQCFNQAVDLGAVESGKFSDFLVGQFPALAQKRKNSQSHGLLFKREGSIHGRLPERFLNEILRQANP